jgi:hypothetical protein
MQPQPILSTHSQRPYAGGLVQLIIACSVSGVLLMRRVVVVVVRRSPIWAR